MFELDLSRCAARNLRPVWRRCLAAACLGWLALPAMALEFTTTFAPPTGDARHTFTLDQDSAVSLYSTLSGGATCGNTGFGILSADGQSDVVSSNHFAACSPDEVRGPWALKAGTYQFRMWHNASGGTYMAQLVTASSTRGNDSEPNDTPSSAQSLVLGQPVFGHLGYRDAAGTDSEDHYRFSVAQQGALSLDLTALAAGSYVLKVSADTYYAFTLAPYTGGEPAVYTTASVQDLATRTWMLGLFDVSALVPPGFDLYAGFGRSVEDMLSQGQVRLAHRVN